MVQTIFQCPYSGGIAVYQARNFVELFNDTIQYDDDAVCLQSGIFREAQNEKNELLPNDIKIIPNPANENVTIVLSETMSGICYLKFIDTFGKEVLTEKLDCKIKSKTISTKQLSNGIYYIQIKTEQLNVTQKLIVIH